MTTTQPSKTKQAYIDSLRETGHEAEARSQSLANTAELYSNVWPGEDREFVAATRKALATFPKQTIKAAKKLRRDYEKKLKEVRKAMSAAELQEQDLKRKIADVDDRIYFQDQAKSDVFRWVQKYRYVAAALETELRAAGIVVPFKVS